MTKIHLRATTEESANVYSRCSARSIGGGKVRRNTRATYQFMASEIIPLRDFRNVPQADQCSHCVDMGLRLVNSQRRQEGKQPLTYKEWMIPPSQR